MEEEVVLVAEKVQEQEPEAQEQELETKETEEEKPKPMSAIEMLRMMSEQKSQDE